MTNIYDQHKAAFAQVSAWVVLTPEGDRVASVAIKYPRDGAGRLYAYVHVFGMEMVRGHANGYGYDKGSAAVSAACARVSAGNGLDIEGLPEANRQEYADLHAKTEAAALAWRILAPTLDRGDNWTRALEKAGFRVLQAV